MRYYIFQDDKGNKEAIFSVYDEERNRVGNFKVNGCSLKNATKGADFPKINGKVFQYNIKLGIKNLVTDKGRPVWIPYYIEENEEEVGLICKESSVKRKENNAFINKLNYKNDVIDVYGVPLGKEGIKNLVYRGGFQIGQINMESVITNDLFYFTVDAFTEYAAFISIIATMYWYIISFYKEGRRKGNRVFTENTKDKLLLAKYNANFTRLLNQKYYA